jgi:Fe-S oxidoreductase
MRAKRLSEQTFAFAEFLKKYRPDLKARPIEGEALVHGHCHHKSVVGMDGEKWLFSRLGLDYRVLDSGCCGMAGSFGFESKKYGISQRCGERVLLPSVREAKESALLVADGFSCREQVQQLAGKNVVHSAQVLWESLKSAAETVSK